MLNYLKSLNFLPIIIIIMLKIIKIYQQLSEKLPKDKLHELKELVYLKGSHYLKKEFDCPISYEFIFDNPSPQYIYMIRKTMQRLSEIMGDKVIDIIFGMPITIRHHDINVQETTIFIVTKKIVFKRKILHEKLPKLNKTLKLNTYYPPNPDKVVGFGIPFIFPLIPNDNLIYKNLQNILKQLLRIKKRPDLFGETTILSVDCITPYLHGCTPGVFNYPIIFHSDDILKISDNIDKLNTRPYLIRGEISMRKRFIRKLQEDISQKEYRSNMFVLDDGFLNESTIPLREQLLKRINSQERLKKHYLEYNYVDWRFQEEIIDIFCCTERSLVPSKKRSLFLFIATSKYLRGFQIDGLSGLSTKIIVEKVIYKNLMKEFNLIYHMQRITLPIIKINDLFREDTLNKLIEHYTSSNPEFEID